MSAIAGVLRCLGPICFIGLQLSSASTATQILRSKSVGQLSCIPFASLFVNCVIWSLYGVLKGDMTVLVPNATGIFVSVYCLWAYLKFNTANLTKVHTVSSALIIITLYFALRQDYNSIGLLGCLLSIIVSGSPLAVMKTVIEEKSTAAMPFATSLVMWVNNLSWACYGYFIANDAMIYGPNGLGLVLTSAQLMLFGVYGIADGKSSDRKTLELKAVLSAVTNLCDDA